MENKTDLRVIKTKKAIYDALILLMKDKTFEQIKVSDICSKALINRSTFYSHYNDKYELLVDFINQLKTNILMVLEKNKNILSPKEYYIELIKILMDHIEKNKDVYYSIIINNKNSIMTDILYEVTILDMKNKFKESDINNLKVPGDIILKFYLGGIVNIILDWLSTSSKYTKDEIISYIDKLIVDIKAV